MFLLCLQASCYVITILFYCRFKCPCPPAERHLKRLKIALHNPVHAVFIKESYVLVLQNHRIPNCQNATALAAATFRESTPWDMGIRTV